MITYNLKKEEGRRKREEGRRKRCNARTSLLSGAVAIIRHPANLGFILSNN
ncbi:hypothetical protein QUB60_09545 [Microcoleus sp. A2-C5]|uniref:hypothetical protein n=1 Tax=Microcoleaceae TaxID=1892252 RepID=UPI002238C247|nr:hypothetical protein [Lyngbya sp. CCAP 1446/10]MCW6052196.1 hypothetical protein [Lyngbya sp. CCAP 1446/10]